MFRTTLYALLLATSLLAAGCGGTAAATYTSIGTPSGASSDPSNVDAIAQTASSSAYFRLADGHAVIVAIWPSVDAAKSAVDSYKPFGGQVERLGNATLAWDDAPTSDDEAAVRGALGQS